MEPWVNAVLQVPALGVLAYLTYRFLYTMREREREFLEHLRERDESWRSTIAELSGAWREVHHRVTEALVRLQQEMAKQRSELEARMREEISTRAPWASERGEVLARITNLEKNVR